MRCYCCDREIASARKVKLRPWREFTPGDGPDSAAYQHYREEITYRWAVICQSCYSLLDNEMGLAEIPGRGLFNLAGASRGDKAATLDEAKYEAFRRREAAKLGLDL